MSDAAGMRPEHRVIAVEEAFSIPEVQEALKAWTEGPGDDPDRDFWGMVFGLRNPFTERIQRQLVDLEGERLEIMDAEGVDLQVLSLTSPGVQVFERDAATGFAQLVNDRVAEVVARHPDRFVALATIAPQDPVRAADEIRRAIEELGLCGVMVNSHTDGGYLDEPAYWPILEAAEAMRAPIYLHPRAPSSQMAAPFRAYSLSSALWGYQAETGLHAMRLLCSGVFDRFPDLTLVLGHLGEGLPFWKWRVDFMHAAGRSHRPRLELTPGEYLRRNVAITTSGMNWPAAVRFCQEAVGTDRICFAVDYPYQDTADTMAFLRDLDVRPEDKVSISSGNAERLFHLT